MEWGGKERKKRKTEKVGHSHSPVDGEAGCLPGTQMRSDSETERHMSLTSHSGSRHLDLGGIKEGPDRSEPRAGGSPGRVLGGREHLSGVYVVICKM